MEDCMNEKKMRRRQERKERTEMKIKHNNDGNFSIVVHIQVNT